MRILRRNRIKTNVLKIARPLILALLLLLCYGQTVTASSWQPMPSEAEITSIQGKTLVFNQLVQNGNFASSSGWVSVAGSISVSSNVITYTPDGSQVNHRLRKENQQTIGGHKYYISATIKPVSNCVASLEVSRGWSAITANINANVFTVVSGLLNIPVAVDDYNFLQVYCDNGSSFSVKNVMLIDLTLMYGAGNEPATVEEFKTDFPADYYAYNTGEFINTQLTGLQYTLNGQQNTLSLPIATYFPDGMCSARTVYDELTKDKATKRIAKYTVTGNESWQTDPNYPNIYYVTQRVMAGGKNRGAVKCDRYQGVTKYWASLNDKEICQGVDRGGTIAIKDTAYSTVSAFKEYLRTANIVVYYELETPVETPINPPLNFTYSFDAFTTELFLPQNTGSTPVTTKPTIVKNINTNEGIYQADVNNTVVFQDLLTDVPADATNATMKLTGNFTYNYNSFTVPNNVNINLNSHSISSVAPTHNTFVGWAKTGTTAIVNNFTAGNTYDAIFQKDSWTITYYVPKDVSATNLPSLEGLSLVDDGNYYKATQTFEWGDTFTLPTAHLEKYTFSGWYMNPPTNDSIEGEYTGLAYYSLPNNLANNITFYARFKEAPTLSIQDVHVYRNLYAVEDRLITFVYQIKWNKEAPTSSVNEWFNFRLMDTDGSTLLATTKSFAFFDYGYDYNVGYFYFGNDDLIEWNGEYQIRIDGDASKWADLAQVSTYLDLIPLYYFEGTTTQSNKEALTNQIINYALFMEDNISDIALATIDENGNNKLTSYGQMYFGNSIPNLANMTIGLFDAQSTILTPDYSDSPTPASKTLIEKWESQYEGTWVQDSLEALGDLFGMNWRIVTSIIFVILWVILASISQIRWGTTDAGMWCGGVLMAVGVTMGIMDWAIVGVAMILLLFYSIYIIFWRQG